MPRMLTLRLWSLSVWLAPFILLVLKYIQLRAELRIAGSSGAVSIMNVLDRRLDDPSFWAMIASALAALLILLGTGKIGGDLAAWAPANAKLFGRWGYIAAGAIGVGYLLITGLKKEALFYILDTGPEHQDPQMLFVQAAEGIINLVVILVIARFFSVALIGIEHVRQLGSAKDKSLKAAATCFVCSGTLPLSIFLFAPLTYQVLTWAFGAKPDFMKPWPFYLGLLSILPMAIPFGIVAIRGLWGLRKLYRPSFNTLALLHVVVWSAMISMGLANHKPPRFLVSTDGPPGILFGIIGMFCLATPLAFWVSYD